MKIAVITGASSGLGTFFLEEVAKKYPELEEVWIIAEKGMEKMEELSAAHKDVRVRPLLLDLSKESSFEELDELYRKEEADIRLLANNAGVETVSSFAETPLQKLELMVHVNVRGVMMMDRISIPYMKEGSAIVHTSSIYSFAPVPGDAVYAASKAFVRYLSIALHHELKKKGIKVLSLNPGSMKTALDRSDIRKGFSMPYLEMKEVAKQALEFVEKGKASLTLHPYYKAFAAFYKTLPASVSAKILGRKYL
ncbi:MAG: SDR family NAD(P)-dependent oxidoreductase [Erysipelotrichaceae bacterium]|nr:SDR family NAD(P)-dependent oxidoreductase [Erysipelotrichaceae bacterium]